ncbi:MAG: VWA domain-containing protein [bacterium]
MSTNSPTGSLDQTDDADEILLSIRRRRLQVAAVALVASCIVHIILAVFFPDFIHLRTWKPGKETKRQFVVKDIKPLVPENRPEGEKVKSVSPVNLPVEAGKAPGRVDKALLEPRITPARAGEAVVKDLSQKGDEGSTAKPAWQPQPDALVITRTLVDDSQARIRPRRYVQAPLKAPDSGDYTVDRAQAVSVAAAAGNMGGDFGYGKIDLGKPPVGDGVGMLPGLMVGPDVEIAKAGGGGVKGDEMKKRLERLLVAEARKYVPSHGQYDYCIINIRRIGEETLPVLPKDILLVQDCSASMTEQRLHFCREGWTNALSLVQPGDRFNVVRFRDQVEKCFPDWTSPDADKIAKSHDFIDEMKSIGETDVYGSLRKLLDEKKTSGRPLIALVVSDGMPTVGETDSSNIIEDFSGANKGGMSIFAMGTTREANAYLLDLLGYRNRGDSFVVNGGRWEIPVAIAGRMRGISRPVLTDVSVAFAAACRCESFPELAGNLYLDRALVLFCRYPKKVDELVFQITGRAGETECDMVFKLKLAGMATESEILRTRWALQKIYNLTGEYTRTRNPKLLKERQAIAGEYGIKIPYQTILPE